MLVTWLKGGRDLACVAAERVVEIALCVRNERNSIFFTNSARILMRIAALNSARRGLQLDGEIMFVASLASLQ